MTSSGISEIKVRQSHLEHRDRQLIASPKHTFIFLAIIIALGIAGTLFQLHLSSQPAGGVPESGAGTSHTSVVPVYLSAIIAEWALLRFVRKGIRAKGVKLRDIIGGSWTSARRIGTDLFVGAAIWLIFRFAIETPAAHLLGSPSVHPPADNPLVSHSLTLVDIMLWVLVSVSAGFCEEIAFRGYLQTQLRALTGSSIVAVFLQAVVFAFGHAYEGLHAVVVIGFFGLLFGLTAWWRRSLRPGMIAHAWADIFENLLANMV